MSAGLDSLRPDRGSKKRRKRVGRGEAAGGGMTAGRGTKGQRARSGSGVRPGFEGGQMPLQMRLPKRGFTNARFRRVFAEVNLEQLNRFDEDTEVTPELLRSSGLVKKSNGEIKILARGELEQPLTIKAHRFSRGALEKIEAAGGKAEVI
ncbi:MAG: 50S ribosomal protein L15 [Thermaerobacterales bacterium]